EPGSPAEGDEIRVRRMAGSNPWFVTGSFELTAQKLEVDRISLLRPGISGGAGMIARVNDEFRIALQSEATATLVAVRGQDLLTGVSGRGEHGSFGLQQGLDVTWTWSPRWAFVA